MLCRFALILFLSLSTAAHGLVQLRLSPLVGGPGWLPVHVKVVVRQNHVWDFLPLNPTRAETTKKLVSLKSVPGEVRYRNEASPNMDIAENQPPTDSVLASASTFAKSYPNDLHLITNNCWTFALALVWHLQSSSSELSD